MLASLTNDWQSIAELAQAFTAKNAAVAYRCRIMAGNGLIEADQVPFKGGPMKINVYRLKPEVKSAAS